MYKNFVKSRITELRLKKNISERELSFSLGKTGNYINQITSGKSLPRMDSFFDICDFFEITPFEFFFPSMENPIISKKIYEEIIRISNNNDLEEFLLLLETMKPEDYSMLISFISRFKLKIDYKNK